MWYSPSCPVTGLSVPAPRVQILSGLLSEHSFVPAAQLAAEVDSVNLRSDPRCRVMTGHGTVPS